MRAKFQRKNQFRPGLESLERRELMAGNVTAALTNGVLRVEGSAGRDWIVAHADKGQISIDATKITKNGAAVDSVAAKDVTRIELVGQAGDDFLAVLGADAAAVGARVKIVGGAGRDAIVLPTGATNEADAIDKVLTLATYNANPLQQSRFELLYKFRDKFGFVGHYDAQKGEAMGDGEGALYTAIAAIGIATGNYKQDSWEAAEANTALEELLGALLTKAWGNKDNLGREHPIRHPNVFEYDRSGKVIRNSPMTKDAFGAIVAAAHYSYDSPNSSQTVRQLARNLLTKWSEYLVLNQYRTHSNYITGEFETVRRGDLDKTVNGKKADEAVFKYIFSSPVDDKGAVRPLFTRQVMSKGPESFMIMPHELYSLQNAAARMGIPTSQWNPWNAPAVALSQTLADVAAPYLGKAAGKGVGAILEQLKYDRSYDIKLNLGGREVSILSGRFTIAVPESVRKNVVAEVERFVTDAIKEVVRLNSLKSQSGDLVGLALNRVLDLLPNQLGKDSWRSLLTDSIQQVVPWLSYSGVIETGTMIANLQLLKAINKPDVAAYTFWTYAVEMETRPVMADLLKPFVQEYFSFLRGNDNPNTMWAWLADDRTRVQEHLRTFETRIAATDLRARLSPEFAFSSTKFNDFIKRSEVDDQGKPKTEFFPRLDYVVVQGLNEKGPPKTATASAADLAKKIADAAERAFNRFVESVKDGVKKAGGYLKEWRDAAGNYVKERWDTAGNYIVDRRDAAGKYVTERWDAANNYVTERGDALGKTYTESRNAAGVVLSKGWKNGSRWIAQSYDKAGKVVQEWLYHDAAGQKLNQFKNWAGGKLTNFQQYTAGGVKEIDQFVSTGGKWVSQTFDSAGKLLNQWLYHDDVGQKLHQFQSWANGKVNNFQQFTTAGWKEAQSFVNSSGKWVSQSLNQAGGVVKEWLYQDDAGQKLGEFKAWANGKLTDFERYTAGGWKEIDQWVNSSGKRVSQTLDSAGKVLRQWLYHDDAGQRLAEYGAWANNKLTSLQRYLPTGTISFEAYISTTGNWVEKSYSNGVATAVRVWNTAGKYVGDQLKNYSDALSRLDPTTKNWWPF